MKAWFEFSQIAQLQNFRFVIDQFLIMLLGGIESDDDAEALAMITSNSEFEVGPEGWGKAWTAGADRLETGI